MRAKICRDVDLEMLDRAIAKFRKENFPSEHNSYNYLIMSEQTRKALSFDNALYLVWSSDRAAEYKGNKIAIDQSIPYGEVEIR